MLNREKIVEELTSEKFRKWVTTSSNDVIMRSNDPKLCPIVCYLRSLGYNVTVYPSGIYNFDDDIEEELPKFAEEFIYILDNSTMGSRTVTGEEVLDSLDEALRRVNRLTDQEET